MVPEWCTGAGAAGLYGAALQADPGNAEAASNRALCLMYGGDLAAGIRELEAAFLAAPERLMQVRGHIVTLARGAVFCIEPRPAELHGSCPDRHPPWL